MNDIIVLVKVEGVVDKEKVKLVDITEDGTEKVNTVTQSHITFPNPPNGVVVQTKAINEKKPHEQIWFVNGPASAVLPFLANVTPLTLAEADELSMKWQGFRVSEMVMPGMGTLYEPEKG
ncbi:MAG: hypothetical protein PHZ19_11150 [Candidatus Thermoplasmatota archaeon]|nr:hypothetical protein [Candidatus Thermoplasmatota archaeon]